MQICNFQENGPCLEWMNYFRDPIYCSVLFPEVVYLFARSHLCPGTIISKIRIRINLSQKDSSIDYHMDPDFSTSWRYFTLITTTANIFQKFQQALEGEILGTSRHSLERMHERPLLTIITLLKFYSKTTRCRYVLHVDRPAWK